MNSRQTHDVGPYGDEGRSHGESINGPFTKALRAMREARGLSQNKLAALAKYDRSYLVRLEDGSRQPSRVTVMAIAEALNLSDDETDELRQAAGFAPRCNTEVERFRRLPPDVQRAVLDFVEKVVTR